MDGLWQYAILIIGFLFIISSIIWFAAENKKTKRLLLKSETEKKALGAMISDVEIMVNELGSFSDYLVKKIESKNNEAEMLLNKLNEAINSVRTDIDNTPVINNNDINPNNLYVDDDSMVANTDGNAYDILIEKKSAVPVIMLQNNGHKKNIARGNLRFNAALSRNGKYSDVLRCVEEGMGEAEIAKLLDIGRGEVSLILGLREGDAI
jgi:hypothetical protein